MIKYLYILLFLFMFTGCYTHFRYVKTYDDVDVVYIDTVYYVDDFWFDYYDPFWRFDVRIGYYIPPYYSHWHYSYWHNPYWHYYPHYRHPHWRHHHFHHWKNPAVHLFKDKHRRKSYGRKPIHLQRRGGESSRRGHIRHNSSTRIWNKHKAKVPTSKSRYTGDKRRGKRTGIIRDKSRRTIDRGKRSATQVIQKRKFRSVHSRDMDKRSKFKRPSSGRKSGKTIRKINRKKR